MFPCAAGDDIRYSALQNIIIAADLALRFAGCYSGADFMNIGFGELRRMVSHTHERMSVTHCIVAIISLRSPFEIVCPVVSGFTVAVSHHFALRAWSMKCFTDDDMPSHVASFSDRYDRVAAVAFHRLPLLEDASISVHPYTRSRRVATEC